MKVAKVTVNLEAGTAEFVTQMERAKGKVIEFSSASVGSHKAVAAAMKELEGNFTNNTRAADQFIISSLKLGPVLQAAFPLIGGLAFGGMIVHLSEQVYDFFKKIQDGREKASGQWSQFNQTLGVSNAELELTNAKLEQQINKLQGKPQIALEEVRVKAMELGKQLDADLEIMYKLFKETDSSWIGKLFGGMDNKALEKTIGGHTGYGGLIAKLRESTTSKDQTNALDAIRNAIKPELEKQQRLSVTHQETNETGIGPMTNTFAGSPQAAAQAEVLQKALDAVDELKQRIVDTDKNIKLNGINTALTENKEVTDKWNEAVKALGKSLEESQAGTLTGFANLSQEEEDAKANIERIGVAAHESISSIKAQQDVIAATFDNKAITLYIEDLKKAAEQQQQLNNQETTFTNEANKHLFEEKAKEIEAANKQLEKHNKLYEEQIKNIRALQQAAATEDTRHKLAMVPNSTNPMDTLQAEQAIKREAIAQKMNDDLHAATTEQERQLAIANAQLSLDKQRNEQLELQKQVNAQIQTAQQIGWNAEQQAINGMSEQLANLVTGQKTSFGKTLQGIGHSMVQESIKSMMEKGSSKLGIKGNPMHVVVDSDESGGTGSLFNANSAGTDLMSKDKSMGTSWLAGLLHGASGASGAGGAASSLPSMDALMSLPGGAASSLPSMDALMSLPMMAGGGDLGPNESAIVGEHGWEVFTPGVSGTVTPQHGLGGATYNIDARGADLGAANRIDRALSAVHASAVNHSVKANADKAKRRPQRSNN